MTICVCVCVCVCVWSTSRQSTWPHAIPLNFLHWRCNILIYHLPTMMLGLQFLNCNQTTRIDTIWPPTRTDTIWPPQELTLSGLLQEFVGSQIVSMIRFADDKAVVASSERGLQSMMDNINRDSLGLFDIDSHSIFFSKSRQGYHGVNVNIE